MTETDGRLWIDDDGALNATEGVPQSRTLDLLLRRLKLLLAGIDSCEASPNGDYQFDVGANRLRAEGLSVLWADVSSLAIYSRVSPLVREEAGMMRRELEEAGVPFIEREVKIPRSLKPLSAALLQLAFAIKRESTESWPSRIPAATIDGLRAIAKEIEQHKDFSERAELFAIQLATQATSEGALGTSGQPATPTYAPASAFPKAMRPRLRHAAKKDRKTKHVRTQRDGGVVLYCMEDARRWWPNDFKRSP